MNEKCPLSVNEEFYKLIQLFKRKIRFGKANIEETNLFAGIQNLIKEEELNELIGKIDLDENIRTANFYTDVDAIFISIRKLLIMFKRFGEGKEYKVKISYYKEKKRKILEICHDGTGAYISSEDFVEKLLKGNGELSEMRNITLKSRCDWQIEAGFTNGIYRIILLDSDNPLGEPSIEPLSNLKIENSFIHKMIFL